MSTKTLTKKTNKTAKKDKMEIGLSIGCLTAWKSVSECEAVLKGLKSALDLGYELSIIAKGDAHTLDLMLQLQALYPQRCKILEENDKNREWVLRHSDVLLVPHTPSKIELQVAQNNKLVPLTVHNKYLENFNPSKETGQAFLFEADNEWDFVRCVVRAAENKQFGYDWGNLKKALGKVSL